MSGQHVIIIAEIGECFNGDFACAERLMRAAKEAGCDFAKFQTLDEANIAPDDPERDWFCKIALNPEKIRFLIGKARMIGIDILFTPENAKTAGWLFDAGLRSLKLASNTLVNHELLDYANQHFSQVFLSTGMASLSEVEEAVSRLQDVRDLSILHCVSEYPTGPLLELRGLKALSHEEVRLYMMRILMERYPQYRIGYSDHTAGILAPLAAVAMGAKVIEKHVTENRRIPLEHFRSGKEYLGTDHVLSLEPEELKEMVIQIREVEKMFGPRHWERSEGEKILRSFLRGRFADERT